jgi:hypothetical protein
MARGSIVETEKKERMRGSQECGKRLESDRRNGSWTTRTGGDAIVIPAANASE